MKVKPLEVIVEHWRHRAFGYVWTYVGGGPYKEESRDRKWIFGCLRRFSPDDVREAIAQNRGRGSRERWLVLADAFGVKERV